MPTLFYRFYQGEVKRLTFTATAPAGGSIATATCTLRNPATATTVGSADQAMTVAAGAQITTPAFTWSTLGWFTLQVTVTDSNGGVDKSIIASVQVLPVPD
jgi:hypothetical protein